MSAYQPCCAECNGCPECDPGLAFSPTAEAALAEVRRQIRALPDRQRWQGNLIRESDVLAIIQAVQAAHPCRCGWNIAHGPICPDCRGYTALAPSATTEGGAK